MCADCVSKLEKAECPLCRTPFVDGTGAGAGAESDADVSDVESDDWPWGIGWTAEDRHDDWIERTGRNWTTGDPTVRSDFESTDLNLFSLSDRPPSSCPFLDTPGRVLIVSSPGPHPIPPPIPHPPQQEDMFEASAVVSHPYWRGIREHEVQWVGFPESENTWERRTNFVGDVARLMVEGYDSELEVNSEQGYDSEHDDPNCEPDEES